MIYTSCYDNAKNTDPRKYIYLQVSVSAPDDWNYRKRPLTKLWSFIPHWELVNKYKHKKINEKEYEKSYIHNIKEELLEFDIKFLEENLNKGKDILLLCWEKDTWCHRTIVAKILKKLRGWEVKELEL